MEARDGGFLRVSLSDVEFRANFRGKQMGTGIGAVHHDFLYECLERQRENANCGQRSLLYSRKHRGRVRILVRI